jgi:hypothetical protein
MFSAPKKTNDGRYYVKTVEKKLVQLNGVTLASGLHDPASMTFSLDATSWGKVSEMDGIIIEAAKENSESWFQRKVADKTIEAAYVKPADIMNVSSVSSARVYQNKEEVDSSTIPEGSICDIVLEFSGVWFAKKTFGPTWKLVQTRVRPPPKKKYEGYLFQDDEDQQAGSSDED